MMSARSAQSGQSVVPQYPKRRQRKERHMRKRGSVVAVLGAALILSACSSTATETTTEEPTETPTATEEAEVVETVSLRWRTRPDNQAETDLYASISDAITAKGIGLDLTYEPGNSEGSPYQDKLKTELSAGTAPDVFWIPGRPSHWPGIGCVSVGCATRRIDLRAVPEP